MRAHLSVRLLVVLTLVACFGSNDKVTGRVVRRDLAGDDALTKNGTTKWSWLPKEDQSADENGSTEYNGTTVPQNVSNWCVHLGNPIAEKNLTKFRRTNACCKEHVMSAVVSIEGDVRRRCSADLDFLACLRKINSTMSRTVGNHYFNAGSRRCFDVKNYAECGKIVCYPLLEISSKNVPHF